MSRRNAMPEVIDPAMEFFGRKLMLPDSQTSPKYEDLEAPLDSLPTTDSMDTSLVAIKMPEESCNIEDSDNGDRNPTSETASTERQNTEGVEKGGPEASKAAAFKKPDKIIPCPRCNSMETKFCYFNNYNVTQPRHFCRSCQRYWTAGGATRNIPVGAGRRKSKHASTHLQTVVIPSNGGSFTQVKLINPDKLTLEEPEHFLEASTGVPSSSCSSTRNNEVSHDVVHKEKVGSLDGGFIPSHNFQGFPGPPPYPWNFSQNGVAYGNLFLVPWISGLCMPNMPFPFLPPMCSGWDAVNSSYSGNTSPRLGKHSRDTNSQEEEKKERNLWIPKTLRIDDPEEAAKSSIWSTLGITPGKSERVSKGGMFKAFQPRDEGIPERFEADETLKANPAALSRSKAFQENR